MVDVIHRTTLEFKPSVNTPDHPEPTWKHNPNMAATAGVPFRYWKAPADWNAVGAGPVEMTSGEKSTVDTNLLTASRDAVVAGEVDNLESIIRAVCLILRDEQNIQANRYNEMRAQILAASSLANLQSRVTSNTSDMPVRTIAQLRTAIRNALGT